MCWQQAQSSNKALSQPSKPASQPRLASCSQASQLASQDLQITLLISFTGSASSSSGARSNKTVLRQP